MRFVVVRVWNQVKQWLNVLVLLWWVIGIRIGIDFVIIVIVIIIILFDYFCFRNFHFRCDFVLHVYWNVCFWNYCAKYFIVNY